MISAWEKAVVFVLGWEGGLGEDVAGGVTNFGISQTAHPEVDVEHLTEKQAREIYRVEYWDKCRCHMLPDGVALVVFDEAVNQGVHAAVSDLQEACGVEADGVVGPVTLAAVNERDEKELIRAIVVERMERYRRTVLSRPETEVFVEGWQNRAEACLEEALS